MVTLEDVKRVSSQIESFDEDFWEEKEDIYIYLSSHPSCCTCLLLQNLGGSPNRGEFEYGIPWENFKKNLHESCRDYQEDLPRYACVTAVITTDQTVAATYLEYIGFSQISQMKNPKHPDNELQIWTISGNDLYEFVNPRKKAKTPHFKR